jgi:hypothetical protein
MGVDAEPVAGGPEREVAGCGPGVGDLVANGGRNLLTRLA